MRLVPCSRCQRHIRTQDGRCPFCGERAHHGGATAAGVAAVLMVGLGVAAGCAGSTDGGGGQGGDGGDGGAVAADAAYGPPPADAQGDAAEASDDDASPIAAYGPPPDAGAAGAYGPPAQ